MACLTSICLIIIAIYTIPLTTGASRNGNYSKEYLTFLQTGTDESVEPCDDLFQYACGKFVEDLQAQGRGELPEDGISRLELILYDSLTLLANRIEATAEAETTSLGYLPVNVKQMLNKCKSLSNQDFAAEVSFVFEYMLETLKLRKWVNGYTEGKTWSEIKPDINPFEISLIIRKDFGPALSSPGNPKAAWSSEDRKTTLTFGTFFVNFNKSNFEFLIHSLQRLNPSIDLGMIARVALHHYHQSPYFKKHNAISPQEQIDELGNANVISFESVRYCPIIEGVAQFTEHRLRLAPSIIKITKPVNESIDVWGSDLSEGMYLSMVSHVAHYILGNWLGFVKQSDKHPENDAAHFDIWNYGGGIEQDLSSAQFLPSEHHRILKKSESATVRCMGTLVLSVEANALVLYLTRETLAIMDWEHIKQDAINMLQDAREATREFYEESAWGHDDKTFMDYVNKILDNVRLVAGVNSSNFNNKTAVDFELSGMHKLPNDETFVMYLLKMNQFNYIKQERRYFNGDISNRLIVNAHGGSEEVAMYLPYFSNGVLFNDALPVARYATTGMVMGHEFEHATMSELHRNSSKLRLHMSKATQALYKKNRQCLVTSYNNNCQPFPTEHGRPTRVCDNGTLDFTENIADNVGIRVAFSMFKRDKAYGRLGTLTVSNRSLSPDQQFFLAFAKGWCSKRPEAYVRKHANNEDPHAPNYMRVNGAAKNFKAFADAFQCAPTAPMNQAEKCRLFENM